MKELNQAAEKAEALFGKKVSMPILGNWAKWYHMGIPDEPKEKREEERAKAAVNNHCLECTALSGCFFNDDGNKSPIYPHHPKCHCKKFKENPTDVNVSCPIEKIENYIFSGTYESNGKRKLFESIFGYTIDDSSFLQSEYGKQALEKYVVGDYKLGKLDDYGQRINIYISLDTPLYGKTIIKTGWMVKPNGLITCNTPYGGKK